MNDSDLKALARETARSCCRVPDEAVAWLQDATPKIEAALTRVRDAERERCRLLAVAHSQEEFECEMDASEKPDPIGMTARNCGEVIEAAIRSPEPEGGR